MEGPYSGNGRVVAGGSNPKRKAEGDHWVQLEDDGQDIVEIERLIAAVASAKAEDQGNGHWRHRFLKAAANENTLSNSLTVPIRAATTLACTNDPILYCSRQNA